MMPPTTACIMRMRLFGMRNLTLLAHSAAAKQPPNMPMIIIPVDAGQRCALKMDQFEVAPLFGMDTCQL
ncbi:hypothetical protein HR12_27285 [Microbacterium sp. SUBG005]|nr:hypothetical protein HR12_27285 [Microbacterium sp. SUBG005]